MRFGKRLLKNSAVRFALAGLCGAYLLLIRYTVRWTIQVPPETKRVLDEGGGYIGCFWHGRILVTCAAKQRDRQLHMLISGHRDGLLVARGSSIFGVSMVTGSSSRGGGGALRRMQRLLDDDQTVGITPDGPRGPRMRAKLGAIKIAQMSGAPLLPVSGGVTRRTVLSSWDSFCLAWPFCRGVVLFGEPITVPADLDPVQAEDLRLALESQLNALTAEADQQCGRAAIEPAPPVEQMDHARA